MWKNGCRTPRDEPVDERVDPLLAGPPVQRFVIHRTWRTRSGAARYSCRALSSGIDRTRTLRGAVCGAVAAAVWALQQPLDKLAFSSPLRRRRAARQGAHPGRGLVSGRASPCTWATAPLFGAAYANLAPALPLPPVLAGPSCRRWSSTSRCGRSARCPTAFTPRARSCPSSRATAAAFAQATWRHLLFGLVLGELERRVNAAPEHVPPEPEADYSSNGHGSLEHALTVSEAGSGSGPVARASRRSIARPHHRGLRVRRGASRARVRASWRRGDRHLPAAACLRQGRRSGGRPARRRSAVRAAVSDRRPDVIYHLAALASVGRSWEAPAKPCRRTWPATSTCSRRCA